MTFMIVGADCTLYVCSIVCASDAVYENALSVIVIMDITLLFLINQPHIHMLISNLKSILAIYY